MKKTSDKEFKNARLSLTLLFSCIVFLILLVSLGVAVLILYLLTTYAHIPASEDGILHPMPFLLLVSAVSLIVGIFVTFISSTLPLKPINRIINQINRLAGGDFTVRLSFGRLARSYPALAETINSFNLMAKQLEGTEMLRSDFINDFSHEFKTPIVSIAGFAKLLKEGNLTEEERGEYISIIEEESLRLASMATNVLELTRVESQSILTDVSSYNLSEQIRGCVLLLERKWESKELEMDLDFDEHNILASEELMKQVWINLLDNAIKFCPEKGRVGVKIRREGNGLTVAVSNTGSNISPEDQKKIFNKFYQADKSHATSGNGIGLAIVKRVVSLHQGNVTVQSEPDGVTFSVWLPRKNGSPE